MGNLVCVGFEEDELGAALAAEPDLVARPELALSDPFAADERTEARLRVAQPVPPLLPHDLGVLAGDLKAGETQIVRFAPSDPERISVDRY